METHYYVIHKHGNWTDYLTLDKNEFEKFMEDYKEVTTFPNNAQTIVVMSYQGEFPEELACKLENCFQ